MPDEEIDIRLQWEQRNAEVAGDAAGRIDRISDALVRMRLAKEAADARLSAMQGLGLFNMPEQNEPLGARGWEAIRLGPGTPGEGGYPGIMPLREITQEVERQNVEVERQHNWWGRIRDAVGDVRVRLGNIFGDSQAGGGMDNDVFARGLLGALSVIPLIVGKALQGTRNWPVIGGPLESLGDWLEKIGNAGRAAATGTEAASTGVAGIGPAALALIPLLAIVVVVIMSVATAIATLTSALVVLTAFLGAAITILGTFAFAGAGALLFLGLLGGGFLAAAAAIIAWGAAVQGGTTASADLTKATTGLQKAQEGLDASQLAISKWYAGHPFGPQNQKDVLTLKGLMDHLKDSQEKVTAAQDAYNTAVTNSKSPLETLIGHLDTIISEQLEPLAVKVSNTALTWIDAWLVQIAPGVVSAGGSIIDWIGKRIIPALSVLRDIIKDVGPDFKAFGEFLGNMFDRNTKGMGSTYRFMADDGIRLAITVVETLLGWLEQLTHWFMSEGPDGIVRYRTYGLLVQEILGGIANLIATGVLPAFGRFADWVVANWPSIKETVHEVWAAIQTGAKVVGPALMQLVPMLVFLWENFKSLSTNSKAWEVTLLVLGGTLALLLITVGTILLAVDLFVGALDRIGRASDAAGGGISRFDTWLRQIKVPQPLVDIYNMLARINGWPLYNFATGAGIGASLGSALGGHGGSSGAVSHSSHTNNYKVSVSGANLADPNSTSKAISRALRGLTTAN